MVKLNSGFHSRGGGGGDKLIIRMPDTRVLSVIAKSILLAFAIMTFPWFGSTLLGTTTDVVSSSSSSFSYSSTSTSNEDVTWMLSTLFRDLTTEGLLQSSDKAIFVNGGGKTNTPSSSTEFLNEYNNQMDLISEFDLERQSSISDETFDFVFTYGFQLTGFIDRTLKTGGIVTICLSDNQSNSFERPANYKIVYIRRFESTIVAMKKTHSSSSSSSSYGVVAMKKNRKLLEFVSEAKKEALNGLEGVLLEPPRAASEKLRTKYMKRTKYLPDIMGDSLDGYPRRVFIDVGSSGSTGGGTEWFERNYPTRNRDFKKYQIETVSTEEEEEMMVKGKKVIPQIGMSEWLRKNVKEEEYVVMKAEAEVVEEMVNGKAIGLVDELFMECKYGKKGKSRRAYWECLALYGRLRDEGVAVHQWWGS